MDQYYYEEDYIEASYYVYIAEAVIDLRPYIEEGYIDPSYYEYYGITSTLTGDGVILAEIEFAADLVAAFTQTAVGLRIQDSSAALAVTFTQTSTISHIEGADLFAFSEATIAVVVDRIRDVNTAVSTEFSVAAEVTRIKSLEADADSLFSAVIAGLRSRDFASSQSAAFSLTADVEQRIGIIALVASAGSLTAQVIKIVDIAKTLSSAATLVTDYDKIFAAPTQFSGGAYDTAVINTSTTKFGTGSLGWTLGSDVYPTSDVFWTGTEFVAANTSYKWTSTDGITWTRASISGGKIPLNYANGYFFNSNQYSTDLNTWSTISATIPGSSSSFISSIGYTGGYYYILTQYISSSRYLGGYSRATTLGGTWTHTEVFDGGTTSTGNGIGLVDFTQGNNQISVIVSGGTGSTGVYSVRHFNGATVTNITPTVPFTLQINTVDNSWESHRKVATKSSTEFLISARDNQNLRRDAISYKNGASTGNFVFGTAGGSDQNNKYVINKISFENNTWFVASSGGLFKSTAAVPTSFADFTLVSDKTTTDKVVYGSSKYLFNTLFENTRYLSHYSTDATTWTTKTLENTTGNKGYLEYTQGDGSDLGNFSTIDFWAYVPDVVGGTTYPLSIVGQSNQVTNLQWGLQKLSGAAPFIRVNRVAGDVNDDQTHFVTSGDTSQGWHHIRISASGANLAVYYDGVRKIYRTDFLGTFAGKVRIQSSELLIDEFLITDTLLTDPSVTTFSVPTTKWTRDSNTDLLLRFDSDFSNAADLAPVIPRANLFAVASVVANTSKQVIAQSSLSTAFTQTVEATKFTFVEFEAAFTIQAAISSTEDYLKLASSTLSSEFNQTVSADKFRPFASSQSSAFTQTAEAVKTAEAISNQTANALVTATISHIHGADLSAFSDAALTVVFERIRSFDSTLAATVAQTVDAVKTAEAVSSQNAEFALAAAVARTRDFDSAIDAAFTQAVEANRTRDFNSSLGAAFTTSVSVIRIQEFATDLTAQSNLSVQGNAVLDAVISTEAIASNLTVEARIRGFFIDCETAVQLVALVNYTTNSESYQSSVFTASNQSNVITSGLAEFESMSFVFARARLTLGLSADLIGQSSLSSEVYKITDSVVALQSQFALSGDADEFSGLAALLTATTELAVDSTRIRFNQVDISSAANQNSQAFVIRSAIANFETTSQVTCTISHIEGADLVANGFATLVANVEAGKLAESNPSAVFTQSAEVSRTRGVDSSPSSSTLLVALVNEVVQLSADLTAQISANIVAVKITDTSSNQTALATVICTISHIEGADIIASSFAALAATVKKTTGFQISATTAANLTVTADKIKRSSANLAASTSLSANAVKVHRGQATLQAQANISAIAGKRVIVSANITSAMTFIAQVREIDIDSVNQVVYIIPREIWTYRIAEEIWTRNIAEETRIYTIKEE